MSVTPEIIITQREIAETAANVEEIFESFSDEIPVEEAVQANASKKAEQAKDYIKDMLGYIQSAKFKEDINRTAMKHKIPPKKLAKNFLETALGTVGDVLGIAINSTGNIAHTVVDVLPTVMHGAVNILVKVANALARVFTLNKTCIA